jgi:two-component system response regulator AtoC
MATLITLESLIETHEEPFVVIDRDLRVVAVNRLLENFLQRDRRELIGQPCYRVFQDRDEPCSNAQGCPHQRLLTTLEPYNTLATLHAHRGGHGREPSEVRIKGYPLSDAAGNLYLGEAISALPQVHAGRVEMVGRSAAFTTLLDRLERAAASDVPVLLEGETGTGKELAAEYIHQRSRRSAGSFVTVDCTVIGEQLFESELFGHEKGSFTGSTGNKVGLFELADGGTLFLDEVGEMPLSMQPKLLRALESGTFRRVGGTRTRRADVRVVCATNRRLAEMVEAGTFRQDLYYRTAVLTVPVPPLRERREDIPLLAEAVLARLASNLGKPYHLELSALERLMHYAFPGNIRELRNVLQVGVAMSRNGQIRAEDLPVETTATASLSTQPSPAQGAQPQAGQAPTPSKPPLQALEARYIADLLTRHGGHRAQVARALGVSERTLYRKLKRYGLN